MANDFRILHTDTSTYVLTTSPMTWPSAKTYAANTLGLTAGNTLIGGHLASVENSTEQASLASWILGIYSQGGSWPLASDGGNAPYVWLGGSDMATEGNWVWSSGESLKYTNWGTGSLWNGSGQSSEPDNYQGKQDALAMGLTTWPKGYVGTNGLGGAGQWNDLYELNALPSLIEFDGSIKRVKVGDYRVAFDLDGNAGKVAKILASVFGASAVSNKAYAGIGLNLIDNGTSYADLSALAIKAAGATTREVVVDLLWTNLMGSHPSTAQAKPYVDMLAQDLSNLGTLGVLAADYAATIGVVNLTALKQSGLEYTL